jgi:hypothetical protein
VQEKLSFQSESANLKPVRLSGGWLKRTSGELKYLICFYRPEIAKMNDVVFDIPPTTQQTGMENCRSGGTAIAQGMYTSSEQRAHISI